MRFFIGLPVLVLLFLLGSEANPKYNEMSEVIVNRDKATTTSRPFTQEVYNPGYDYSYGKGDSRGYGNFGYQSAPHKLNRIPVQEPGDYPKPQNNQIAIVPVPSM